MIQLHFKPIEIIDRELLYPAIYEAAEPICDISFANLFAWSLAHNTRWVIAGVHTLVIQFDSPLRDHPMFLCPFCKDDQSWLLAIEQLQTYTQQEGYPFVFMGVTDRCKQRLERLFPDQFMFFDDNGYMDYIYSRDKLATLSGKKLQSKRNHINKFSKLYPNHRTEAMNADNLPAMRAMAQQWLDQSEADDSLHMENRVINRLLDHFDALELTGLLLYVDDRLVAFTIGSPITHDTYGVHVEKALTNYEGAYTMINREFARTIPQQYAYVNREEDLGLPGLRKAKESYKPVIRLLKETALWRRPDGE